MLSAVTDPFVTVAVILGTAAPALVGFSIVTVGGLVSLYPEPPSRRDTDLIPLISVETEAPEPFSEFIVTFGGYSNLYSLPLTLAVTAVMLPESFTREYPTASVPKDGIGASIENTVKVLPLRGASSKMKRSLSVKKSTFGTKRRLS